MVDVGVSKVKNTVHGLHCARMCSTPAHRWPQQVVQLVSPSSGVLLVHKAAGSTTMPGVKSPLDMSYT